MTQATAHNATYLQLVPLFQRAEKDHAELFAAVAATGYDTPALLKPFVVQYVAATYGYVPHASRKGGELTFVKDSKGHNTTRYILDRIFSRVNPHCESPSKKEEDVKVPKALVASLREMLGEYDAKQIRAALSIIAQADKAAEAAKKAAEKIAS